MSGLPECPECDGAGVFEYGVTCPVCQPTAPAFPAPEPAPPRDECVTWTLSVPARRFDADDTPDPEPFI